ncbi:restriction endonuclease subunit S [Lactobacillus porci]|uniref:restriction endonuclease subunit S n=1 Tax=Lactobacillus porci TaxID=2012477 RepID=UPI0039922881
MTKLVNLEDCCEILDSQRIPVTAKNRIEGPYPYYGANGIQDYVADYIFDDELVLLAEDGGNFGSKDRPIAYRVSGKCWVNNHAHVLKPKPGLDIDYLCYSLAFYDTSNLVNGATRKKLTQSAMRKMKIPLLPLNIQMKIVDTIKKVRSIISVRQSQLDKLDTLVKARFVEMFGDPVKAKDDYPIRKFTEFAKIDTKMVTDYNKYANYPHIGIDSIEKNTGKLIGYRTVKEDGVKSGKYLFTSEHIIYSKIRPNLNKVALPTFEGLCSADSYPILPNTSICNRTFLAYVLRSEYFLKYIIPLSGRSNMPKVNKKQLQGFEYPIPPLRLQNEFADFVQQVDKSKVAIQKSLDETQLLFDSLMQEYFS